MPRARGSITGHVTRVMQDNPQITSLVLSERQVLELISALTVALSEKEPYPDGYHLALWKGDDGRVKNCQANPPCDGGEAHFAIVRLPKGKQSGGN